ncbi:hypothetical protein DPMN_026343, partial [Dreissena polymorpha]
SLPHSIHHDSREVCLFVKDLDQKNREYEKTVQHFEDVFREKDIHCISKIIPLKALRTDYSMYAAKRSLAKAYDLYLADDKVFGMLPGLLGKIFFAKKKLQPIPVNLSAQNLKSKLEDVVNNTRLVLEGTGSSSCVTVAHNHLSKSQIVDNMVAACSQVAEKLPGGQDNIKNIYIKGADTKALPVYFDFGGLDDVDLPDKVERKLEEAEDEITTVEGARVKIRADGQIQVITVGAVKGEVKVGEGKEGVKRGTGSVSSDGDEDIDSENEDDDSDMENDIDKAVKVAREQIAKVQPPRSITQTGENKRQTKKNVKVDSKSQSAKKMTTVISGDATRKNTSPSGKRNVKDEAAEEMVTKKRARKTPVKSVEEKVKESITKKGRKARKV